MPTYYSIDFQYDRAAIGSSYLRELYAVMLHGEFSYGGVLTWECPGDLGLDEVIRWNQERLDRDFDLGFTEHFSNDYRQLLLLHPRYSECRVIVRNRAREVSVIVPEADVFGNGVSLIGEGDTAEAIASLLPEQVAPRRELALSVWGASLAASVQTHGELGAATEYTALMRGEFPSMLPFAVVNADWTGITQLSGRKVRISPAGGSGLLLERV